MVEVFTIIDLTLMVISIIALSIFVSKNKKKFEIEGPMYLYRTKFGLKVIDWFGKKHSAWLKALEYPLYIVCYVLMISGVFYFTYTLIQFFTNPQVAAALKAPIIFPVIPYFTEFFGLKSYLPTFYFVSFLFSVGITMVIHEFSHGIYARMYGVKIKSTGFALLRAWKVPLPFFGAFVEQDDKQMVKASKRAQLSIIGAGVFSNILTMIAFTGILWVFFLAAYQPAGVVFDDYAKMPINVTDIQYVNGISLEKLNLSSLDYTNMSNYAEIKLLDGNIYFTSSAILNYSLSNGINFVGVYENSPAFKSSLRGLIAKINGTQISSSDQMRSLIQSFKPGETVRVETLFNGEKLEFNLNLSQREGKAYLGIATYNRDFSGVKKIIVYLSMFTPKRENFMTGIVYSSKIGDLGGFIFNLLWWVVLLNFAVAIANMLPAGFFDGGRFFLLTVWGITGSKKAGEKAFKWSTYFIIALLGLFMVYWFIRLF